MSRCIQATGIATTTAIPTVLPKTTNITVRIPGYLQLRCQLSSGFVDSSGQATLLGKAQTFHRVCTVWESVLGHNQQLITRSPNRPAGEGIFFRALISIATKGTQARNTEIHTYNIHRTLEDTVPQFDPA